MKSIAARYDGCQSSASEPRAPDADCSSGPVSILTASVSFRTSRSRSWSITVGYRLHGERSFSFRPSWTQSSIHRRRPRVRAEVGVPLNDRRPGGPTCRSKRQSAFHSRPLSKARRWKISSCSWTAPASRLECIVRKTCRPEQKANGQIGLLMLEEAHLLGSATVLKAGTSPAACV
jgi:hypothetical protein